jgi:hypothetical protein
MPAHTIASRGLPLVATIQCEGCDQIFKANAYVMAQQTATGSGKKAADEAQKYAQQELQKKIDRIQQGQLKDLKAFTPCPHCGYTQTWMIPESRRLQRRDSKASKALMYIGVSMIIVLSVLCFPVNLVVLDRFGLSVAIAIASFVLGVLVLVWREIYYNLLYNPNKAWLKERGIEADQAPAPRAPINLAPFVPGAPG